MADPARAKPTTFVQRRKHHIAECREMACIPVRQMLFNDLWLQDPPCVLCVHEAKLRRKYEQGKVS